MTARARARTSRSVARAFVCLLNLVAAPAAALGPGDVLVADFPAAPSASRIVAFDAGSNPLGPFADESDGLVAPRDLALDAAGNVYVADNAYVLVFDGAGGAIGSITQGLTKAVALTFGGAGQLYVSNRVSGGSSEILRYSAAGTLLQTWIIPEFDSGGPTPFAREIAFGPDGLLYLALRGSNSSSNDNLLATLDPATGDFAAFARAEAQVTMPIGLLFEAGGTILVVNDTGTQSAQASRIVRLDTAGSFVEEFWSQDAVRDLALDGFGRVHGADRTGGVLRWDPDGALDEEYGTGSLLAPIALVPVPATAPFCGNEIVEPGEGCDDGNADPCDGCSAACVLEFGCGDGSTCGAEQCDDANAAGCDGCSPACVLETCGDGVLCPALREVCDDGNGDPCDGCSPACLPETCGNGVVDCSEQCDDANTVDCDGCTTCGIDELLYRDEFESGTNGWSTTGLWNQDTFRWMSPNHAWYYGQPPLRNYLTVFPGENSGTLTSPPIDLTALSGAGLSFGYLLETEDSPGSDVTSVELSRDGFAFDVQVLESPLPERAVFGERQLDLSPFAGDRVQLRFGFDTVDDVANQFEGFYVDDVTIRGFGPPVCGNGMAAPICGEACDDGNVVGGDGCSATCQAEGVTAQVTFTGSALGGAIEIAVSGVPLSVETFAGDSSATVASRVAAAINADSTLQALGVTAVWAESHVDVIGGSIDSVGSSDPGIAVAAPVPALPRLAPVLLAALLLLAVGLVAARLRTQRARSRI